MHRISMFMAAVLLPAFAPLAAAGQTASPVGPVATVTLWSSAPALPHTDAKAAAPRALPRVVLGGVAGGGAGLLVGGILGAYIGGNSCYDDGSPDSCDGVLGMAIGALVGQAVGVPLGAHFANARQGELRTSLLASSAITAAGIAAALALDSDGGSIVLMTTLPIAQIVSAVLIERATSR